MAKVQLSDWGGGDGAAPAPRDPRRGISADPDLNVAITQATGGMSGKDNGMRRGRGARKDGGAVADALAGAPADTDGFINELMAGSAIGKTPPYGIATPAWQAGMERQGQTPDQLAAAGARGQERGYQEAMTPRGVQTTRSTAEQLGEGIRSWVASLGK